MTTPHVFVTMGSLLNFKCDAWLLPTDARLKFNPIWTEALRDLNSAVAAHETTEFEQESELAVALDQWPAQDPMPVLTAVPLAGVRNAEELRPRFRAFFYAAEASLHTRTLLDRPHPLLAVPFFGTDHGAGGIYRGDILHVLLDEASIASLELGVDVVFVFHDPAAYSLAQQQRKERALESWSGLSSRLQATAVELAERASRGQVVPFMGAGVSMSAGAPSWEGLLETIANAGQLSNDLDDSLKLLPVLDQAGIIKSLYEADPKPTKPFGKLVAEAVNVRRYGLAPALLAALPSDAAITLNYDQLFEMASFDAHSPRTVIPDDISANTGRWLLKLHGSVANPDSIVLTRDDYLGYNANRDALSSMVKAHLLTHHLLFVGFGLTDTHFHEIIFDVRRAIPAEQQKHFGTVLTLHNNKMQNEIWKGQLDIVPMAELHETCTDGEAARLLEIFLDMLVAYSSESHSFFLAPHYSGGMTQEDLNLRKQLLDLAASNKGQVGMAAWHVLEKSLTSMGWDPIFPYAD